MGWYFRKSFNAGPIRINISKSGIGYSFGTKGFRIGSGPRGRYLRMGAHGIYYYQSLNEPKNSRSKNKKDRQDKPDMLDSNVEEDNLISAADTTCSELPPSESCIGFLEKVAIHTQFLADLDSKYKEQIEIVDTRCKTLEKEQEDKIQALKDKYWQDTWFFFFVPFLILCIVFPLLPFAYLIYNYFEDKAIGKKIKKIEKDFKPKFDLLSSQENLLTKKYEDILKAHENLNIKFSEEQIYFLEKTRDLFQNTSTNGDIVLLSPKPQSRCMIKNEFDIQKNINFDEKNPGDFLTEQTLPSITIDNYILYFFPQGLLLQSENAFSELSFHNISIEMSEEHVAVTKRPRKDAIIEGDFWEHARVDGTPDRRFKENAHYFIVRYYGVLLQYKSLFVKPFYFSNPESAKVFCEEFNTILQNIPQYPRLS